ncbi:MAG: TonB-dependent receptor [Bryobacteraceae bacterium]|nr:TonB-dependent receptor [Bryobacteraceae bacterium]
MRLVSDVRVLALLGALAVGTIALHAQSTYGGLRGFVADAQGKVIAGSKVTLVDQGTNQTRSALTNESGEYNFSSITPATYRLDAEAVGFKKYEQTGILVGTQQFLQVDVKMEVGSVSEAVTVVAETPLLDTATASQGQVIERQQVVDLPNLGRNPFMLSRLAPTVQQAGNPAYNRMQDQSGSSQISINGGPVRGNNYLLDGIPITDFSNRAVIIPSLEAVEEMKVQYSTYDSEMGRTGGGMFNTLLKSGTNQYHGSLLGYMRETSWLANTFFNNRSGIPISEQPFRNYGGSFGGPIRIPKVYNGTNKTFFWLGFEGYRDTQAASLEAYTPTALERTGDFSQTRNSAGNQLTIYDPASTQPDGTRNPFAGNVIPANRIDTVGRNVAATYVNPTRTSAFYGSPNVAAGSQLPSIADQHFIKLDHQLTSWWRASVSYLKYNSSEPGENNFGNISSPGQWLLYRKVNATQVNSTMTPSATWVVAVRYGFNRFPNIGEQKSQGFDVASLGFNQAFVRDIPSRTFPNFAMQTAYGLGTNNNFNYIHHSKNFGASASKYVGKHSLKFGYDFRRLHADGVDLQNSSGAFSFSNNFTRQNSNSSSSATGSDIADLLLGAPSGGAAATGYIPTVLYQYSDYNALYIQDDFRVTPKLTLNLGLRWERETGLRETYNNLITGFDASAVNPLGAAAGVETRGVFRFAGVDGQSSTTGNPNLNKFSPRIGVAYQLTPKIVLRGGYGIFWAPMFYVGSPLNTEGITANTQPAASIDGNRTPAISLSNPFPNGLDRPVGNTLGAQTGIGKSLTIFDPNATSTRVQQFSVDVQYQINSSLVVSGGYSGSRTADLTWTTASFNYNQLNPSFWNQGAALNQTVANPFYQRGGLNTIGGATVARNQLLRPHPQFAAVNLNFGSRNMAQYDSAVLKLQKRYSSGLTFIGAYTWSKNFDMGGGGPGNFLNAGNSGPQDVYSLGGEYGLSYLHSPHRFTSATTYELPFGKGKTFLTSTNRVMDLVIGGWSVNAVTTIQTGYPLQIFMNNNGNASLGASRQRPNATGVSPEVEGEAGSKIDNWINRAAFSDAAAFTLGNVSRTIPMRGPGQANCDLSVFKTASIAEKVRVQFRAEALNAFNTPLFRAPNTALGNGSFGRITSQANFPRMIQLGMRIFF